MQIIQSIINNNYLNQQQIPRGMKHNAAPQKNVFLVPTMIILVLTNLHYSKGTTDTNDNKYMDSWVNLVWLRKQEKSAQLSPFS